MVKFFSIFGLIALCSLGPRWLNGLEILNFRILFIFQKLSALPFIPLEYSVNLDKKIIFRRAWKQDSGLDLKKGLTNLYE